jgi:6-phosphogluconolactonase/glucosamine-6-phosphate isomerase/deaminase
MHFILSPDISTAITALQGNLLRELTKGKKVLWIISGGSNIEVTVRIIDELPADLKSQLTIMPVDERYGPVGHTNSNIQQLLEKGFVAGQARLITVLQPDMSLQATAEAYDRIVQAEFAKADVIIGQLGIGPDGHIAGILPDSPAATVDDRFVTAYLSDPYQRITMTFQALRKIIVNYSLVYGAAKKTALQQLHNSELPLAEQPSQILRKLPEVYIYNDQIGDES